MTDPFVVLVVCRANVCRSPLAAHQMTRRAADAGLADVISVFSAGADALEGATSCVEAAEWLGVPADHLAVTLTAERLHSADLVLAVDRDSRAACAMLDPGCRPRLFTLRQAAYLAETLRTVPVTPGDAPVSMRWLVGEWDANRVLLSGRDEDGDDILDRHGSEPHAAVFEEVTAAVGGIVDALARSAAHEPI